MHKTSANNHIHAEQENTYAANRTHKDTVFRDLFGTEENKANTLSLYNALSGKDYTDPNLLELTTIDSVLYMSVKNDISFLINDEMILWEHRSILARIREKIANGSMALQDAYDLGFTEQELLSS